MYETAKSIWNCPGSVAILALLIATFAVLYAIWSGEI